MWSSKQLHRVRGGSSAIVMIAVAALAAAVSLGAGDGTVSTTHDESITIEGLVVPSKHIQLGMPVRGVLANRPIREGQHVVAGQLIAALDSRREKAIVEISGLRAATDIGIRTANADEAFRLYELERQQALVGKQATSSWELRAAEVTHRIALVKTENAHFDQTLLQAQLVRDRILLDERILVAPFSGWISRTLKEEGEAVDEFEPVAVLVQLDPIWIELNVASEHFGRATVDDLVVVRVGGSEKEARIVVVDPVVDAGSSTFRVKVEIENEEGIFVAGTMAIVELSLDGPPREPASGTRVAGPRTPKIILGSDKSESNKTSSSPDRVKMKPLWGEPIWTTEQHDGSPPAG